MDRAGLLNEISAGRSRLEAVLARLNPAQMLAPDLPGGWSLKDLLAHLGWWERWVVEYYQKLVKGESPARPVTPEQVDAWNARILEQCRDWDLDQVRSFEQAAYQEMLELARTMPETDLFDAQRFSAFTNGEPYAEWILGNSSGHYEEHGQALSM